MSTLFENRCVKLIVELGLGSAEEVVAIKPLSGGVSSDIALVYLERRKVCVKFALEKLKVAEDWYAPVERNQAEYQWLLFAASIVPDSTPALLGCSEVEKGFAMEYIEGDDVYLWKTALLEAQPDRGEAEKVGQVLGHIHQASAVSDNSKSGFQNHEDFHALRLEPYLCFTASKYPALTRKIYDLVEMLSKSRLVLVHGDVSPKNIIFRNGVPIFLDAECATIGDPSFDVSFCLNHLILKALHITKSRQLLLTAVLNFWTAYSPYITWEVAAELEVRICKLLPALMLARADGKSPVEYLSRDAFQKVRSMAVELLEDPEQTITAFVERVALLMERRS